MTDFRPTYLIISLVFSIVVFLYVIVRKRSETSIFSREYFEFITTPWRLVTFFIAAVPLAVAAPYTGDPTWDYFDAAFMAILTFVTAPWAVGVIFRFIKRKETVLSLIFALICWMFSASWSYDLYIWIKFREYPSTWAANILASSGLYFSGGLFWSLRWEKGEGATFAFMHEDWLKRDRSDVRKILLWGLPFMVLFGGMLLYFLVNY